MAVVLGDDSSVVVVMFMSHDLWNHVLCRVCHLVNRFVVFLESCVFSSLAKLLHLARRIKVKHKTSLPNSELRPSVEVD